MAARVPTFKGFVSSFRAPGVAVANTPHFTIFNTTGSGVLVAVRQLVVQHEFAALTTSMRMLSMTAITTAPTGGTLLTPQTFDTTQTHVASVEIRGSASADGTASAITSTVGTTNATREMVHKDPTAVEQRLYPEEPFVPLDRFADDPMVLREGEGLRIGQELAGNANSSFLFSCVIEEFTYAVASALRPLPSLAVRQAVNRAASF